LVRGYADDIAERIAQLGASPVGTPGRLVSDRSWSDYALGKADSQDHLRALDEVYNGVIASNRKAITLNGELAPMTEEERNSRRLPDASGAAPTMPCPSGSPSSAPRRWAPGAVWSAIAAGRTTPWARPTRRTTCGRWTRSTTA